MENSKKVLIVVLLFSLLLIIIGCSQITKTPSSPDNSDSHNVTNNAGTRVISTESCGKAECTTLGIICKNIPEREVLIKSFSQPNEKGRIIFTTGGSGGALFSKVSENTFEITKQVITSGFSVYEVAWLNGGWTDNAEGSGIKDAMCGYAEVVKWITEDNPDVVCAYGNSGGSAQVAYSLSVYETSEAFDMVVLSGGPPGIYDIGCFGSDDPELNKMQIPKGSLFREVTDYLMSWDGYCEKGISTEDRIKLLKDNNLVTDTQVRDYNFPNTKVNFVNSIADPMNAQYQSNKYYEKITTEKAWYEVDDAGHAIFDIEDGKNKIIEILTTECR